MNPASVARIGGTANLHDGTRAGLLPASTTYSARRIFHAVGACRSTAQDDGTLTVGDGHRSTTREQRARNPLGPLGVGPWCGRSSAPPGHPRFHRALTVGACAGMPRRTPACLLQEGRATRGWARVPPRPAQGWGQTLKAATSDRSTPRASARIARSRSAGSSPWRNARAALRINSPATCSCMAGDGSMPSPT